MSGHHHHPGHSYSYAGGQGDEDAYYGNQPNIQGPYTVVNSSNYGGSPSPSTPGLTHASYSPTPFSPPSHYEYGAMAPDAGFRAPNVPQPTEDPDASLMDWTTRYLTDYRWALADQQTQHSAIDHYRRHRPAGGILPTREDGRIILRAPGDDAEILFRAIDSAIGGRGSRSTVLGSPVLRVLTDPDSVGFQGTEDHIRRSVIRTVGELVELTFGNALNTNPTGRDAGSTLENEYDNCQPLAGTVLINAALALAERLQTEQSEGQRVRQEERAAGDSATSAGGRSSAASGPSSSSRSKRHGDKHSGRSKKPRK